MKNALTVKEIRILEERARAAGFSEELLIENASSNLAGTVDALALGKKVLVVAGWGNNGADVLACARKLAARNYQVRIFLVQEKEPNVSVISQIKLLLALHICVERLSKYSLDDFPAAASASDFIIDGILGIGARGKLSDFLIKVVAILNQSGRPIVACDIPSGLAADSGAILGAAIRAAYTVTFIAAKQAFFMPGVDEWCGNIITVDVGISRTQLEALVEGVR